MSNAVSARWRDETPPYTETMTPTIPGSPFRSFFMGGFECSTHRLRSGRRLDVIGSTAHDRFALQDYRRLVDIGIRTARDGLRWHLIERTPGVYDFDSVRPMLAAAREAGVQVIWDVLHYGWPDDIDVFGKEFVPRFTAFARAFAEVATAETNGAPWVVPVNEISFFAWAGGEIGIFNPFEHGRADEMKLQLLRAAIGAIRALWEVNPAIRVVHTEPMINVVPRADRPQDAAAAEGHRQAQYAALDMIAGRARPELGGREEYLDVIGVNYYVHNQWIYPGGHGSMIEPSHARYRPVWQMLQEVYERYRRPLFIAETGIEDEARPAWLRYVGYEVRRALREGVPVLGVCLYPIVNHPGWDDDRHCYNGLWDYATEDGAREIYAPLASELDSERRLLEAQLRGERIVSEAPDAHQLDIAAHWMEIRSGREEELQR
jgi:beta-glucosidase/6-phospho-beta-glucosidase/beta-galactosidase